MRTGGNVVRAAQLLGLSRNTLRYRMRCYGIARPPWEALSLAPTAGAQPPTPQPVSKSGGLSSVASHPQPPSWEQKSVVVLAVALTFPSIQEPGILGSNPWTAATHWKQTLTEKVHSFGGVLLQHSPALLLVAFGIPRTLDQMPQRAVQAALAMRRLVVEAGATASGDLVPAIRLAAHVGQLLVDGEANDPTARILAVGEILALPARLLGHAATGNIVLSPQMARLVEGWFALQTRQVPLGGAPSDQSVVYTVCDPCRHR